MQCHEIHKLLENVERILTNDKVNLQSVERVVSGFVLFVYKISRHWGCVVDNRTTTQRNE
jgi:hypothetical protein